MIDAAVFDLDGVLTRTAGVHAAHRSDDAPGRPPPRMQAARGPGQVPGARALAPPRPRRQAPRIRVLALPVLLVIAAIWRWFPDAGPPPGAHQAAPATAARSQAPLRGHVQLGMDRDTVAGFLGEPVARDAADLRWVYGPSWLRFECGRLVDWYSSPLRPLRVDARRPTAEDRALHASRSTPCLAPTDVLARQRGEG